MGAILCAVRGGPASQHTIKRAIGLALKKKLPLHFLYVVNLDFFVQVTGARMQTAERELKELGEFILTMAMDEATQSGVSAITHVRQGNVHEQIIKICIELGITFVVVGATIEHQKGNVPPRFLISKFGKKIEAKTRATIVVARPGESSEN